MVSKYCETNAITTAKRALRVGNFRNNSGRFPHLCSNQEHQVPAIAAIIVVGSHTILNRSKNLILNTENSELPCMPCSVCAHVAAIAEHWRGTGRYVTVALLFLNISDITFIIIQAFRYYTSNEWVRRMTRTSEQ